MLTFGRLPPPTVPFGALKPRLALGDRDVWARTPGVLGPRLPLPRAPGRTVYMEASASPAAPFWNGKGDDKSASESPMPEATQEVCTHRLFFGSGPRAQSSAHMHLASACMHAATRARARARSGPARGR